MSAERARHLRLLAADIVDVLRGGLIPNAVLEEAAAEAGRIARAPPTHWPSDMTKEQIWFECGERISATILARKT